MSLRDLFANWSASDAPLHEKLRQVVGNNARKIRTASTCCGHPGEPGC